VSEYRPQHADWQDPPGESATNIAMFRGRTLALLLALAMLAFPATGLAQNAGDDQYSDPLAGQGGGGGSNGGGSSGSVGSSGSNGGGGGGSGSSVTPSTPTSGSTGTQAAAAGTNGSPQGTAGGGQGELPRTGFDVIVTIELGLAMLLAGLVAQRVLVLRDRRDS
jgi:hypothetical protein